MRTLSLVLAAALLSSFAARADGDDPGCKDPKVLQRYPKAVLWQCSSKEYDEVELPMDFKKDEGEVRRTVGGQVAQYDYSLPESASATQVWRNLENALAKAGFKILVGSRVGATCCYLTAQLKDTVVSSVVANDGYTVTVVQLKEMEQKISADASALLEELNKSGHVAVYGINFETGKAAIQPDSEPVLAEVAKLLTENEDLKLRVEGHTDNAGKKKDNLALSKKRAAAVKDWLVKKGVAAERLTADGFGDTKPAADNATEEGRAKNRRVELVKL